MMEPQPKKLVLPTCKCIEVIDVNSIIRIEAISNYSKLYFNSGKTLVVAKVLAWFEEQLISTPCAIGHGDRSDFI